jgi:hypothetical protein
MLMLYNSVFPRLFIFAHYILNSYAKLCAESFHGKLGLCTVMAKVFD